MTKKARKGLIRTGVNLIRLSFNPIPPDSTGRWQELREEGLVAVDCRGHQPRQGGPKSRVYLGVLECQGTHDGLPAGLSLSIFGVHPTI